MHLIEDTLTHFQYVSQPNSNLNYRKYAKTIPYCVFANSNPISKKLFHDDPKLCLRQIPIASHRKYSRTIPNCVLANFQVHLIENVLGQFQIVP